MKAKLLISFVLISILLVSGCAIAKPAVLVIPSVAAGEVSNPKLELGSHYKMESLTVSLDSPSYPLPLALTQITNLADIEAHIPLEMNQRELLENNGFVVIPWHGDDIVETYKTIKEREIPVFVTSDTLLHLYHIQFNEILKRIEEEEFFDQLIDMSKAMLERSIEDYERFEDPELQEAAKRNVAYFAVALELLQTPTEGYDEQEEREKIEQWNQEHPWDQREFVPIRTVDVGAECHL